MAHRPPSPLVEAWRLGQAVNLLLLDGLPEGGLEARYSDTTRTVAAQFAHVHNVRVYHIGKRAKAHLEGLESFPRRAQPPRRELRRALRASATAVERLLAEAEAAGKVKGFKGAPASFLGYLLSHEAHHRGLVLVSLRMAGIRLPKDVTYGLWMRWNQSPA